MLVCGTVLLFLFLGFVTFPDDTCTVESENCSNEMIAQNTKWPSSVINVTEINTDIQDDAAMEIE